MDKEEEKKLTPIQKIEARINSREYLA